MKKTITNLLCAFLMVQMLPAQSITWLSNCSDVNFCLNAGSCTQGNVLMTASAVANNCGSQLMNYSYRIDLFNNGSIDLMASNDTVSGNFDKGTHKITWKATDNCGNSTNCTYLFTIKDCQPPNLLCLNGLTQQIEQPNCSETFLAKTFILNLSDNCTPTNQIQIGIREVGSGTGFPTDTSLTFGKCDKGVNFVEILVKDANGLINQCNSYVLVQDADNDCVCNQDADITMTGCVKTSTNQNFGAYVLKTSVVSLSGATPPINKFKQKSTSDSCYSTFIDKLPFGATYQATIKGEFNVNPLNGVSTLDLVQLSKHILNIEPFTTAYQALAADVNRSNTVTTFDIVEIRKLILGFYDTFPKSPAWFFIRPLPNPSNVLAFTAVQDTYQLTLPNLQVDYAWNNLNFVAVKSGDINGSATPYALGEADDRNPGLEFGFENRRLLAGQSLEFPVSLREKAALQGWQMALHFDPEQVEITDVEGLPDEQIALHPQGELRLLDYGTGFRNYAPNTPLFSLKIRALKDLDLNEALWLQHSALPAEAYGRNGRQKLSLNTNGAATADPLILTPKPNPMRQNAQIEIWLPESLPVNIEFFDLSGRSVFHKTQIMDAGWQNFLLESSEFSGTGVYLYRVECGGTMRSGKLVLGL